MGAEGVPAGIEGWDKDYLGIEIKKGSIGSARNGGMCWLQQVFWYRAVDEPGGLDWKEQWGTRRSQSAFLLQWPEWEYLF